MKQDNGIRVMEILYVWAEVVTLERVSGEALSEGMSFELTPAWLEGTSSSKRGPGRGTASAKAPQQQLVRCVRVRMGGRPWAECLQERTGDGVGEEAGVGSLMCIAKGPSKKHPDIQHSNNACVIFTLWEIWLFSVWTKSHIQWKIDFFFA